MSGQRLVPSRRRVLVTGGAGFLGSHLIDRLLARGDEVICMDDLSTGSMANLVHVLGNVNFSFMEHDVTCPTHVDADHIYNLACPASPVHYQREPILTTKASVYGAINLLEVARHRRARIFQASTSEVYGDPLVHPQPETYWGHVNPAGVRSCYDEGKRCAESLFFDYQRRHQVDVRVARIFNTYGPRMHPNDGRVVSNFIVQALRGESITIYGAGLQTRSFCYVDDLIEGFLRFMEMPEPSGTSTEGYGPVNLGNPGEFTILQLAQSVLRLCGSRSRIVFKPLPMDDPRQRKPDIDRARHLLDWEPRVSLEEGLIRTIAHFDQVLAKPDCIVAEPPRHHEAGTDTSMPS